MVMKTLKNYGINEIKPLPKRDFTDGLLDLFFFFSSAVKQIKHEQTINREKEKQWQKKSHLDLLHVSNMIEE